MPEQSNATSASLEKPPDARNDVLKHRINDLERRVATLEAERDHFQVGLRPANEIVKPGLLIAATALLAIVPPLLVVRDRWLGQAFVSSSINRWWGNGFLRYLRLPPYFLLIFACFLGALVLIWYNKEGPLVVFSNSSLGTASPTSMPISPAQASASRILLTGSGIGLAVIILRTLILHRLPGWDLALALLGYALGWIIREIPIEEVTKVWHQNQGPILSVLLAHLALIEFLAGFSTTGRTVWIFGLLLAVAIFNLLRYYRKVSVVFWIVSLALVLYTLHINSWWFAMIGDEGAFFDYASYVAERQSLADIGSRLFWGQEVYGTHPYLSSLTQALFMKFFGSGNFGWRFSNMYLSALAIVFFFLFFETFVPRRIALLVSLFLTFSEYLMSFGKVGYNNLHALFAMSLALWAAAWALRTMRSLAFVVLGLTLGFCFYTFPAALYVVPLPLLVLFLYDPPKSKPAVRRWAIVGLSMFLTIFPLLIQPGYWETKRAGAFLGNPEIMKSTASVFQHLWTNLVYAFVSFVYSGDEGHFVAVSYMDPLSGALIIVGMAFLLKGIRRTRFALFLMIGFAMMLFLIGASHGNIYPPTTRMFLLLPWFAFFAATGLAWMQHQVELLFRNPGYVASLVPLVMIVVLGLNLYQAYPLSRLRMEQHQNLDSLFLRIAMRAQRLSGDPKTFVFITDPEWGIDGMRGLQRIYSVPSSVAQLVQVTLTDRNLPESSHATIADPNSLVIIKPWLDQNWKQDLETALQELGKVSCDVKTVKGTTRFQLWHSGELDILCQ